MPIFIFPYYKSMATESCHCNQSSYLIGTKRPLFIPPAYRCSMWNLARVGFIASEMSFENVDDGQTTDTCLSISSPMRLWLRWASNPSQYKCWSLTTVFWDSTSSAAGMNRSLTTVFWDSTYTAAGVNRSLTTVFWDSTYSAADIIRSLTTVFWDSTYSAADIIRSLTTVFWDRLTMLLA